MGRRALGVGVVSLAVVLVAVVTTMALEPPTAQGEKWEIRVTANGMTYVAPYDRHLTEYDETTGWLSGDRISYSCAYMFLEHDAEVVARVTFIRLPEAGYVKISDFNMSEAARNYDGTTPFAGYPVTPENPQGREVPAACPVPAEAYGPAEGPIGPPPVIEFDDGATLLERRSYEATIQRDNGIPTAVPWEFQIISATSSRVTVVGYQNGVAELVVYYDSLDPSVSMTSNFIVNHDVELDDGHTTLTCDDGSVPEVLSTQPLRVAC